MFSPPLDLRIHRVFIVVFLHSSSTTRIGMYCCTCTCAVYQGKSEQLHFGGSAFECDSVLGPKSLRFHIIHSVLKTNTFNLISRQNQPFPESLWPFSSLRFVNVSIIYFSLTFLSQPWPRKQRHMLISEQCACLAERKLSGIGSRPGFQS